MHSFFLPGPFFKSIAGLTLLGALLAFWLFPEAGWANPGVPVNGFNLAEPAVVRYIYFEDSDPAYAKSAEELARELSLTGAVWKAQNVVGGWNRTGIFLGSLAVLSKHMQPDEVAALSSMENDGYWLHLQQNAGYVAVRSAAALPSASAGLRFALGFRYYLPNRNWEYYPDLTSLPDLKQGPPIPLMANRGMFYGYGAGSKKLEEETTRWKLNNGLALDNAVSTGHSWPGFYSRHKAEFAAHPEWFAAASDGSRRVLKANMGQSQSVSFCVTNKKLIAALQADALQRLQTQNMYSLDPSDGMDEKAVCQCENCQGLGSVSNIVFYLANQVAEAVGKAFPYKSGRGLEFNKMVGMYAYAQHAFPPDFPIHQNVFVLVATAYNSSPLSYDDLFKKWNEKAKNHWGIRDYWGVMQWDADLPGRSKLRTSAYASELRKYAALGAIAINTETIAGWVSRGIGQYTAATVLRDGSQNAEELTEVFYTQMFGKAAPILKPMFTDWQSQMAGMPTEEDLRAWSVLVQKALALAEQEKNPLLRHRVLDIAAYLHYINLLRSWRVAPADPGYIRYIALLSWAWRLRETGLIASQALVRTYANSKAPTKDLHFSNASAPWKQTTMVTDEEILKNLTADVASLKKPRANVKAVDYNYSTYSVYQPAVVSKEVHRQFRGNFRLVVAGGTGGSLGLRVGLIKGSGKSSSIQFGTAPNAAVKLPIGKLVDVPVPQAGPQICTIVDNNKGVQLSSRAGVKCSVFASKQSPLHSFARNEWCFLVPEGTTVFGIWKKGVYTLVSPSGRRITQQTSGELLEYYEVGKAETGIWKLEAQSGTLYLIGVPPVLAPTAAHLIVPTEKSSKAK
ncbi:DUF4838 domain-containing protein [Hymenobacter guriensis]|uniref:DUF4838 domain-containing protein n=1 Tax=Hymenobacter guriensis TaxID=2793065 RepID=A0ABS0KW01_9BACT|nr:DUF4838 domain-containing protein [Hymenobacter guriensis]MBG8552027.1 DUF4838 domain-containing protein [Hymenobacter guriensis]